MTMPRWTVHLDGGPRRVNHAAVAIGDLIFTFGGYCTGEDYKTTRPIDIHILNTISLRWRPLQIEDDGRMLRNFVPYQRYGHTAVGYDDCCYIWGGRNDKDGACNILYCFTPATSKWSRPAVHGNTPGARDGHSACIIRQRMYIFGGYEERVDKFSNEVHMLDFPTMTWSLLKARGRPARWRDFHSATGIGDNMYIFGGRSDTQGPYHTGHELYCNKLQVFDTATNSWHEPETEGLSFVGRRSHSAFTYNGDLFIFGGYNGLHDLHFDDLFKYNPESSAWTKVKTSGSGPCPRRRQCACVIGDRVFLFGGTSPVPDNMNPPDSELGLMDHSDLHVLDMAPSLKTLVMLAILHYKIDDSCLPRILKWEMKMMTQNSTISRPLSG